MVSTRRGTNTSGRSTKAPLKGKRLVRHHRSNAAKGHGPGIRHINSKGSTVNTVVHWVHNGHRKKVVREEAPAGLQERCKATCRIRPKHGHYKGSAKRDRAKLSRRVCAKRKNIVCEYKARGRRPTRKHCRRTHAKHEH